MLFINCFFCAELLYLTHNNYNGGNLMTTAIEHFSDLKQAKHWDVREMSQE